MAIRGVYLQLRALTVSCMLVITFGVDCVRCRQSTAHRLHHINEPESSAIIHVVFIFK